MLNLCPETRNSRLAVLRLLCEIHSNIFPSTSLHLLVALFACIWPVAEASSYSGLGNSLGGALRGCFEGSMSINNDLLRDLRAEREQRQKAAPDEFKKESTPITERSETTSNASGKKKMAMAIDLTQSDEEDMEVNDGRSGRAHEAAILTGHRSDDEYWEDGEAAEQDDDLRRSFNTDFEDEDLALAKQLQQEEDEGWGSYANGDFASDGQWGTLSAKGQNDAFSSPKTGEALLAGSSAESQNLTGDICPDAHQMFLYFDECVNMYHCLPSLNLIFFPSKISSNHVLCLCRGSLSETQNAC